MTELANSDSCPANIIAKKAVHLVSKNNAVKSKVEEMWLILFQQIQTLAH